MCLCGICLRPFGVHDLSCFLYMEFLFSYSGYCVQSSARRASARRGRCSFFMDRTMNYRKSVFFARLKQRSPCLSGFCEPGKRASQMLASRMPFTENACRAKTVLISEIRVKKIFRPKILNYAKQTQFPKCQKRFNLSNNND